MNSKKNIAIWAQANYSWLWVSLAKKLKQHYGCKIIFICQAAGGIKVWKEHKNSEYIDEFVALDHFIEDYEKVSLPYAEIVATARKYEKKYNTLMIDGLHCDRSLGRGFSGAGPGHPQSELSRKATLLKSLNAFNNAVAYSENFFEKYEIKLVIGATAGLFGKTFSVVARGNGIKIRGLNFSKYQSYFHWTVDEYYNFPDLEENLKLMKDNEGLSNESEILALKRLPWSEENYKKYMKLGTVKNLAKSIFNTCKTKIYRKIHGIQALGNYDFWGTIKSQYDVFAAIRNLKKEKFIKRNDLNGIDYVIYPLHMEPESALSMLNPEFNEQLAIVELIAKNLPAGVLLIVKDHIGAMSRRPKDFFKTISEIPNCAIVSPTDYALDFVRGAKAVAVITGTVGTEAVLMGVPVISMGLRNAFNHAPHVHVIKSWLEFRPILEKLCLETPTEQELQERKEWGLRYLGAIKKSSFDLSFADYTAKKRVQATEKEVEVIGDALIKSVEKY